MGRKVGVAFVVLVVTVLLSSIAYGITLRAAPVTVARLFGLRGRFDAAYALEGRRSLALLEHIGGKGPRGAPDVSRLVVIDLEHGTQVQTELPYEHWLGRSGDVLFGRDLNLVGRSLNTGAVTFEVLEHLLPGKDNFSLGVDGRVAYRTDGDQARVVDAAGHVAPRPADFTPADAHRFLEPLEGASPPGTLVRAAWLADSDDRAPLGLALHYEQVDAQRRGVGPMVSALDAAGTPRWSFKEPGAGRGLRAAFRAGDSVALVFADEDGEAIAVRCLELETGKSRWAVER